MSAARVGLISLDGLAIVPAASLAAGQSIGVTGLGYATTDPVAQEVWVKVREVFTEGEHVMVVLSDPTPRSWLLLDADRAVLVLAGSLRAERTET